MNMCVGIHLSSPTYIQSEYILPILKLWILLKNYTEDIFDYLFWRQTKVIGNRAWSVTELFHGGLNVRLMC